MRIETAVLDRPAAEGARLLVQALLRQATEALAQLEAGDGDEALHDFRVALRRLRSLARALRPALGRALRRRHERRLRAVAAATTASRDAEVQLAWLAAERARLGPRERRALDALAARLEARRQDELGGALADATRRFRRLEGRLERRLRKAGEQAAPGQATGSLADLLAGRLEAGTRKLVAALDAVEGPFDVAHAHAARIAGKRLRYQLELLRGSDRADGARAVELLRELQDLLGELHDAHVLADGLAAALAEAASERARRVHAAVLAGERGAGLLRLAARDDPTGGLVGLDVRVADRIRAAHAALVRHWPPARRAGLVRAVSAVTAALSRHAPARAAGGAPEPGPSAAGPDGAAPDGA